MNTRTIALITATLLIVSSGVSNAAELEISALPAQVESLPVTEGDVLKLDLIGAYQLALARNLNLHVGRYDIAIANANVRGSGGIFDPTLWANLDFNSNKTPTSTILEGANVVESDNMNFGLGVTQLLPSGTELGASWMSVRGETNSEFYFLNPRWDARLNLTLTQPLLNGFGTNATRAQIIIAENLRDQAAVGFEVEIIRLMADVELAYWELVATRQAIAVTVQSLELAERLLEETRQRVEVGTSAPIDMVQSEATVATRHQELIYANNAASNAEDNLKALLGFDLPHEWQVRVETTDSYNVDPFLPDLGESIETALHKRPAIIRQELEMERLNTNVKVAQNQALSRLDLTGSYGWGGVSGTSTITDDEGNPVTIREGWGDAAGQVFDFDFPRWTVGLNFSVPMGNHRAKEQLAANRYYRDRSGAQLAALKQEITRQVRFAVRALEDGAAAIDAAVASRRLAVRNLEAEQTKFNNGLSTNFQVSEIQDALATAQFGEIRARVGYRKAIATYFHSTGTFLEAKHVEITDTEASDSVHDYWKDVKWLQFTDFKKKRDDDTMPASAPVEEATD
ncbi:MAG: TolC family protein [Acidobacteria bacterium]|uniref:TolC family protein n=1 Tax=Candidatus Sulfomarinibacter kjeldsenii TaxID=2885994 RepID=A0A8J7CE98_9BACT|nr:TolC family protein [Candidatus Sulfomarinibacter kjeldsenii]